MIKVMRDFPYNLHEYYQFRLDFFSPDFSKFILYDANEEYFKIKDTFTG